MKKTMRSIVALLLVLAFALTATVAFAADDDAAYIKEKGKMLIGITIFDPMNYYDDNGKLIGFDTEFAEAVCAKLGVAPEFVEINWDTKEIELNAKSIDCIWNGMTITEERKENMEFSAAYIRNKQVIVIRTENAAKYTDTASLSGATIVAEISSAGEEAILADENLSKGTYIACGKQADTLLEVKAGTADAAVIDYVMAKSMVGEGTDYADMMIVEGVDLAVEEYGIGFRKGSTMAAEVDAQFKALIEDGTMAAIAEKYGQADVLITDIAK
ncbi:MAG: transporter substrate-binding domain-containing protein [Clostridia bacterium]|nr:transporter substrate-binding domain-containing protein [Clostridia bacterium]